jgi:hypothetical protein
MAGVVQQSASAWVSDNETRAAIYEGMTVSQLAILFGMGPQVVHRRLAAIEPSGRRGRFSIYKVADAAPLLVEASGDIEETIKRMNPRDLPPGLLKEFWTGLRSRQQFELEDRDLWRTVDVMATFAEAFKAVRMSLLLMSDTLEREDLFTVAQRERLQKLVDSALEDCRARLIRSFSQQDRTAADEQGEASGGAEARSEDEFRGL